MCRDKQGIRTAGMLPHGKRGEEQSFMNYDVLVPVVEELSSLLTGAFVERVLQGEDGGLYLLFRKDRKNFTLLLSPDRVLPRMHLVSRKPRSVADPHPLVLNLRSRLPGSRLSCVALMNDDRVVA